jgi:hypothetical protein
MHSRRMAAPVSPYQGEDDAVSGYKKKIFPVQSETKHVDAMSI